MAAITALSGLNRNTVYKARNELRKLGLIDYNEESGKPTIYRIASITEPRYKTGRVDAQKLAGSDGDTYYIKTKNTII